MRDFVAARQARCAYSSRPRQNTQFRGCAPTEPEGRTMNKNITFVVLVLVLAAPCIGRPQDATYPPPMDSSRKVNEQDCSKMIDTDGRGNLLCREVSERERRARIAEEERQARARREAAER